MALTAAVLEQSAQRWTQHYERTGVQLERAYVRQQLERTDQFMVAVLTEEAGWKRMIERAWARIHGAQDSGFQLLGQLLDLWELDARPPLEWVEEWFRSELGR